MVSMLAVKNFLLDYGLQRVVFVSMRSGALYTVIGPLGSFAVE